jgi:hypothetical protein
MTSRNGRKGRHSPLALAWALVAIGLAGCGSDSAADPQAADPASAPEIVAAKAVDSGVEVTYRVPGADGGAWPALTIGVKESGSLSPPTSQNVPAVEEEGTVVVPVEADPGGELVVFGSALYENGERVDLPEEQLQSPEPADEGAPEPEPGQAAAAGFDGSWAAVGRVVYVPPTTISNQPVGSVRNRPWSFREVCAGSCRIVFTRGTLYGPSVTELVERGRFFIADFPPVTVPCAYPRGWNGARHSSGQSHSRYKLWWSNERTRLRAVEHRFQTGCYDTPDKPDITRWVATRAP